MCIFVVVFFLLVIIVFCLFFFFFKQKTAYEIDMGLEFRRVLFRSRPVRRSLAWACSPTTARCLPRCASAVELGRVGHRQPAHAAALAVRAVTLCVHLCRARRRLIRPLDKLASCAYTCVIRGKG